MFVEIEALSDVVCDSSQLGDCRMLFPESKLDMRKEMIFIDKDVSRTAIIHSKSFPSVLRRLIGL
jgi:hypothetical protein